MIRHRVSGIVDSSLAYERRTGGGDDHIARTYGTSPSHARDLSNFAYMFLDHASKLLEIRSMRETAFIFQGIHYVVRYTEEPVGIKGGTTTIGWK